MSAKYFSVDIETTGPIPGPYSMLSLGCVALGSDLEIVGTFYRTLKELPEATRDSDTMEWWVSQPAAWEHATKDPENPEDVMRSFAHWIKEQSGKNSPTFVAYPAGFDFTFVHWYFMNFNHYDPFGFQALDIKTLAWTRLPDLDFKQVSKRRMPKKWFKDVPRHTHHALDDAIGQAILFKNILENEGEHGRKATTKNK